MSRSEYQNVPGSEGRGIRRRTSAEAFKGPSERLGLPVSDPNVVPARPRPKPGRDHSITPSSKATEDLGPPVRGSLTSSEAARLERGEARTPRDDAPTGKTEARPKPGEHGSEGVEYRRKILNLAIKSLDDADQQLTEWIKRQRRQADSNRFDFSNLQFRDTIKALQDGNLWRRIVDAQYADATTRQAAQAAAESLIECIKKVQANQLDPDASLRVLRDAIRAFRREIKRLDPASVTPEEADTCKKIAERFLYQVAAGSLAATINISAGGGALTSRIILAALAQCATSVAAEQIYQWRHRAPLGSTTQAKLANINNELRNSVQFLIDLAKPGPRDGIVDKPRTEQGRDACVYASLLANYAGQLASRFSRRAGYEAYCGARSDAREFVDNMLAAIDQEKYNDLAAISARCAGLWERLGKFGYFFDGL